MHSPLLTPKNSLLRRLLPPDFARLLPSLQNVEFKSHQVLHHRKLPIETVYFVESGLVSVSAKIEPDEWVEVWLIGSEGMTGLPVVLGDKYPAHRRVVQVPGRGWSISSREFKNALAEIPSLRSIVDDYIHVVLLQASQSGACNAHHSVRQRLARWLLLASRSLQSDKLPLTHDVLSRLLGVRRASVSECLEVFEAEGMISNTRGLIHLASREQLQRNCCDCYRIISREYQRLFPTAEHVPTPADELGSARLGAGPVFGPR